MSPIGDAFTILPAMVAMLRMGVEETSRMYSGSLGKSSCINADSAKAEHLLGWTAARNLETMCSDAWRWQLQNPDGYGV